MEVKAGYKKTEVGVIPEDWQLRPMLSAVRVATGQVDPKIEPYRSMTLVAPDHIESSSGRLLKKETARDQCAISGKYLFVKGDIVYSKIRPYLKKAILAEFDGLCSADMYPLKPASDVSAGFILAAILGHHFSRYAESVSVRSGMPKINRAELAEYAIALPPTKAEQEAIAEVLSDADALIGSLEQLLAKKRQLKQGAMQELITGKKRLPGFIGEWEMFSLGSIADPNQRWSFTGGPFGSNLKSSDYTDVGVRIIQLQNIGDGMFKDDYEIFTSRQKADELLSCNIYPGELILSKMGDPVARACIIPPFQERYVMCSDGIRLAVDRKRFNPYFVYTQINAPAFRGKAANAGTGSTRKRIGLTELKGLELCCPSLPEQTAIAAILSDMDAEIAALEAKLAKACQLKQGMMQELLTGRIRLV